MCLLACRYYIGAFASLIGRKQDLWRPEEEQVCPYRAGKEYCLEEINVPSRAWRAI